MKRTLPSFRTSASLPTLRAVLSRGHLKVALVAVTLAGLSLTLLALFALRAYADHNLHLIARSISYTVTAAVVFEDSAAANEVLSLIAPAEEVVDVEVVKADGKMLAEWSHPDSSSRARLETILARSIMVEPVTSPIIHRDRVVGTVIVSGDGVNLLKFLIRVLGGISGCLALSIIASHYFSRRLLRDIVRPLRKLAAAAHSASVNRSFDERVPEAYIAELNDLTNDFNSMLGELGEWHAHIENTNRTLAHEATHDSLTGLPNRAFFKGRLSRVLRNAKVFNTKVAVLFLDSDRFKYINDTYGHAAGDAVLQNVAARVTAQLREHDLVARLGGDEFAVLLSPVQNIDDVVGIVNAILASMSLPIAIPNDGTVTTSLSIGVAMYPVHGQSSEELLVAADAAMYRAKRSKLGSMSIALSEHAN